MELRLQMLHCGDATWAIGRQREKLPEAEAARFGACLLDQDLLKVATATWVK